MYVYTGTRMRNIPYRQPMVPSYGNRFQMGTDATTQNQAPSMPLTLVRAAVIVAAGVGAWKLYSILRPSPMHANLPSWPAIGPLFNVGSTIGSAFSLGPYIL